LLLAPSGLVSRIQLSGAEGVGIRSDFSLSSRPVQLMTVGYGVAISSPQILYFTSACVLEKGLDDEGCISWVFGGLESSSNCPQ